MMDDALRTAARDGNLDAVRRLLEAAPNVGYVTARDWGGRTALHWAAVSGDSDTLKLLLDTARLLLEAAPNVEYVTARDSGGRTALHWAAKSGDSDTVKLLLDTVRLLLEAAPNVEYVTARDIGGGSALHWAAKSGDSDTVKLLLDTARLLLEAAPNMEYVNAKDILGRTALHWAAWSRDLDTVKLLLDTVRLLLEAAPNVEYVTARDSGGRTALHWAAWSGDSDTVKLLLDTARLLLEAAPNVEYVNAKDEFGRTALHWSRDLDTVKLFLAAPNVDANVVDEYGNTFLHDAVWHGHANIVRGVLPVFQSKLRLTHENGVGKTAVQIAYEKKFFDIERALLECDAVKNYIEALYRDRQVYVDAANAILVGAALIASVTFASWLQPPLNYTTSGDIYSSTSYPPSAYDPNFVDVGHNIGLGVFWVFNSLSFYFAIGTVVLGACSVLPRRRVFIKDNVVKLQQNLLWTCFLLTLSVLFVLIAFGTAGFIVLVPVLKLRVRYMIVPTVIGGTVCLVCLSYLLDNIVKESLAVWRSRSKKGEHQTCDEAYFLGRF